MKMQGKGKHGKSEHEKKQSKNTHDCFNTNVTEQEEDPGESRYLTCCWRGTGRSSPGCSTGGGAEPKRCRRWWRTGCGSQSHWPGSQRRCLRKTCTDTQDPSQLQYSPFSIQLYNYIILLTIHIVSKQRQKEFGWFYGPLTVYINYAPDWSKAELPKAELAVTSQ